MKSRQEHIKAAQIRGMKMVDSWICARHCYILLKPLTQSITCCTGFQKCGGGQALWGPHRRALLHCGHQALWISQGTTQLQPLILSASILLSLQDASSLVCICGSHCCCVTLHLGAVHWFFCLLRAIFTLASPGLTILVAMNYQSAGLAQSG